MSLAYIYHKRMVGHGLRWSHEMERFQQCA